MTVASREQVRKEVTREVDLVREEMVSVDGQVGERQVLTRRVADWIPAEVRRELEALQEAPQTTANRFRRFTEILGTSVAQAFSVQKDEVAILLLKDHGLMLRFAYPIELYENKANAFPINTRSITADVLRARKGRIDNDVALIVHLNVYERIRLKEVGPFEIQKMISAPLMLPGGEILGVMQVCRKGETMREAGPDFSPSDLSKLNDLVQWVAPYIQSVIPANF